MNIRNCKSIAMIAAVFFIIINAQAKELTLTIKSKTHYPMNIHYAFSHGEKSYAEGELYSLGDNDIQYITVNEVPDEESVLIHIDKINVVNRTVFNDPCKIQLNKNELTATTVIGFRGDPKTHGSFTCYVTKTD